MTTTSRLHDLAKVRTDLLDGSFNIAMARDADNDHEVIGHLTYAIEALTRALSTLTLAVEREMHD